MTLKPLSSKVDFIPILSLSDPMAGITMLMDVFGFRREEGGSDGGVLMSLGDQIILIVSGHSIMTEFCPHHVALSVPDVDGAMRDCIAKGGQLAASMTPNGPLDIPEFWGEGVRYVFFEGPEGALIEFCAKNLNSGTVDWGQDHIGIHCEDIAHAHEEFLARGCSTVASHTLYRPDGMTAVVFLERGNSIIELFSPPKSAPDKRGKPIGGWVGIKDA